MVVGSVCDLARQVGSVSTQWSKIENSIPKSFLNQYQNLLYLIGLLKKCVINFKKVCFFWMTTLSKDFMEKLWVTFISITYY